MKTLVFKKTGERRELNCDITIFSDQIRILPDKCETIVLNDIQTKHCAIFKDDQIYKIIDFCSFDTKLYTKEDIRPKLLKPLTFYELRDSDTIFIGEHEIVFHSEPDKTDKPSFYVPETQEIEGDILNQNSVIVDDIELPETQVDTPDLEFDTNMLTSFIEPESAKYLKKAVQKVRSEYLVETQPLLNALPPCTRRYAAKQNEIKPKTVPLSVFDCDTQAMNAETQAMTYTQLMNDKNSKKFTRKRKSDPPKEIKKILKNSVLLSDSESDLDDSSSRISAVSVKYADCSQSEYDNSLSQFSIDDDFLIPDIRSPEMDSQFMKKLNASCGMENSSQIINSEIPIIKEEIKTESNTIPAKKESEDDINPPRKRVKLFKFASSDEDDMY